MSLCHLLLRRVWRHYGKQLHQGPRLNNVLPPLSLLAELDPEQEPEREASECTAIVEEGLKDVEAGRNLVSFEEACRRWEAEKAARQAASFNV